MKKWFTDQRISNRNLAVTIFERDKERGGGIVVTMPTTRDTVAVKNSPAPEGKPLFCPSDCVAPPRHSYYYASSSRLAYRQNRSFQILITYTLVSNFILASLLMVGLSTAWAEASPRTVTKDTNHDGKIDTWVQYRETGDLSLVSKDKAHADGKPDSWVYYRKGSVYKREWDRNFDGKPDLRTFEENHRLIETQYDDNFDGKFEKKVKTPEKGSSGHTKTSPY